MRGVVRKRPSLKERINPKAVAIPADNDARSKCLPAPGLEENPYTAVGKKSVASVKSKPNSCTEKHKRRRAIK